MGITFACFHKVGKDPEHSDALKIRYRGKVSPLAQFFINTGGILSGPMPFVISKPFSFFLISVTLIYMLARFSLTPKYLMCSK